MYNVELPPQAHLPGPQKKDCFLLHPPVPRPIPSCRQADAELKFFSIEGDRNTRLWGAGPRNRLGLVGAGCNVSALV